MNVLNTFCSLLPALLSRIEVYPGCWVEQWQSGTTANRRVGKLRRELGKAVSIATKTAHHRLAPELGSPGGERVTLTITEITYVARPEIAARLAA